MVSLVAACAAIFGGIVPVARFPSEVITIDLEPSRVLVDATYVYENPFPFPIGQGFVVPTPEGFEPTDLLLTRDSKPLALRHLLGQHRFELRFEGHQRVEVRLRYRQYTPGRKATYLLTTTQGWGRPLRSGIYRLRPNAARLTASSLPLRKIDGNTLVYERHDFLPTNEWTLSWEAP